MWRRCWPSIAARLEGAEAPNLARSQSLPSDALHSALRGPKGSVAAAEVFEPDVTCGPAAAGRDAERTQEGQAVHPLTLEWLIAETEDDAREYLMGVGGTPHTSFTSAGTCTA